MVIKYQVFPPVQQSFSSTLHWSNFMGHWNLKELIFLVIANLRKTDLVFKKKLKETWPKISKRTLDLVIPRIPKSMFHLILSPYQLSNWTSVKWTVHLISLYLLSSLSLSVFETQLEYIYKKMFLSTVQYVRIINVVFKLGKLQLFSWI